MEMFYGPMSKSQSFVKHVLLDCELHKYFSGISPYLGEVGRLQRPGVRYFPFPT